TNVYDRDECVKRQGQILPVLRLGNIFHKKDEKFYDRGIMVILEGSGKRIAVLVDEIVGIQQVVLKPLKGFAVKKELFSGGALMGDGSVSLIVDVERMLERVA
ncbi:MAG: chemotaxis protein CheW, partial [Planctomycetes bacterium]|nr:chemotaxis protein CheW [Planctomycetota bacterium]